MADEKKVQATVRELDVIPSLEKQNEVIKNAGLETLNKLQQIAGDTKGNKSALDKRIENTGKPDAPEVSHTKTLGK